MPKISMGKIKSSAWRWFVDKGLSIVLPTALAGTGMMVGSLFRVLKSHEERIIVMESTRPLIVKRIDEHEKRIERIEEIHIRPASARMTSNTTSTEDKQ